MANPRLVQYFNQNLAKGYSAEQLKQHLIQNGYNSRDVDDAIRQAQQDKLSSAPPPLSSTIPPPIQPAKSGGGKGWLIAIVVIFVILLVIAAGGYFTYKSFAKNLPFKDLIESDRNMEKSTDKKSAVSSNIPTPSDYAAFKNEIKCGSGYLRHGMGCCSDANSNGICDVDEGLITEEDPLRMAAKLSCGKGLAKFLFNLNCCIDANNNQACDFIEGQENPEQALENFLTLQTEFADAVYECKKPYVKFGPQSCCLDKDGDGKCELELELTLKSAKAEHMEDTWDYALVGVFTDINVKKNIAYKVVFEIYDKNNQLVMSDIERIYFELGARTNSNLYNKPIVMFRGEGAIKFQYPGAYTLKVSFYDEKSPAKPITTKSIPVLAGALNENPKGADFVSSVTNLKANHGCYAPFLLSVQYDIQDDNKGDIDFLYTKKRTYSVEGFTVSEQEDKSFVGGPLISAAGSSKKELIQVNEYIPENCYVGKTVLVKEEYFDRNGKVALSKEYQASIEEG